MIKGGMSEEEEGLQSGRSGENEEWLQIECWNEDRVFFSGM